MSTGIPSIDEFIGEVQEVCNQLSDLYMDASETTPPEIYGSILGLHERLEIALEKVVMDPKDFPEDLRIQEIPK